MKKKFLALLHIISSRTRTAWYRRMVHPDSGSFNVLGAIKIYNPDRVVIGIGTTINHGVILNAMERLTIGDNVRLSPGVIINTGGLDYTKVGSARHHVKHRVTIESGVWIGSGAIINPGVTIGANTVIGAGSVVTKDMPANVMALGVPAVVKKVIA